MLVHFQKRFWKLYMKVQIQSSQKNKHNLFQIIGWMDIAIKERLNIKVEVLTRASGSYVKTLRHKDR